MVRGCRRLCESSTFVDFQAQFCFRFECFASDCTIYSRKVSGGRRRKLGLTFSSVGPLKPRWNRLQLKIAFYFGISWRGILEWVQNQSCPETARQIFCRSYIFRFNRIISHTVDFLLLDYSFRSILLHLPPKTPIFSSFRKLKAMVWKAPPSR
jgi:hypothetical protein